MVYYLRGDDVHFVNHVEDEVEDALLLEQVLPVPQRLQELLSVLVAEIFHFISILLMHKYFSIPEVFLWLYKVVVKVVKAAHLLREILKFKYLKKI